MTLDAAFVRRAGAALLAAVVWPLPTAFGSVLEADGVKSPPQQRTRLRLLHLTALLLFPVLFAAFALVLVVDRPRYSALLDEDGVVEWATVAVLVVAAGLAAAEARAAPRRSVRRVVLYGLAGLSVLVALEEISWGQRIFGAETPVFFAAHSDQKEINIHNVLQKTTHVAMKWPVGLAYVLYGALLPSLVAAARPAPRVEAGVLAGRFAWADLVPPLALARAFLLGGLLMLDLPTNDEEELAELFGVLALLMLVVRAALSRPAASGSTR